MTPYEEGARAYSDGKHHTQNPFTFNSYAYHCWREGYFDASYEETNYE